MKREIKVSLVKAVPLESFKLVNFEHSSIKTVCYFLKSLLEDSTRSAEFR